MTTTNRRPPGAGTVAKMRGRFQARVTLADGRRPSLGAYATREEADDVLHAALEELATNPLAAVGGRTLGMFGRTWLDEREISGDVRDVQNERRRFELHIGDTAMGRLPLRAITAPDVAAWYRALRTKIAAGSRGGKKLSRKTIAEVVWLLKSVFAAACAPEHGILASSPAAWLKVKRELRTVEPWDYLREHEIKALRVCKALPEAHRLIILFAVCTGLRLGEMMNLELADLVTTGEHPEVTVRFGSKGRPPKNGKIRRVPLFGLGLEVARAWLALLPSYAKQNPEGLVFPTSRGSRRQPGKHLHGSRWSPEKKKQIKVDRFKEDLVAAGIARPIRWHDLRHTCASQLVGGGWGRSWSLEETREMLGHTSITSTLRYAHLSATALRRAATEAHAAAGAVAREDCTPSKTPPKNFTKPLFLKVVGRQGLEPWTYGLKARTEAEAPAAVTEARSQLAVDPVEVLRAVARGEADVARELGRELALQVVGSEVVRLAGEVLAGGEFVDSRIVELCELVLDAGAERDAKRGAA